MGAAASRQAALASFAAVSSATSAPTTARARGLIISFDALGTLYRLRKPVGEQYLSVAQQCGFHKAKECGITAKDVERSFRSAFKSVNEQYANYGREELESPEDWWMQVVDKTFGGVGLDLVDEKGGQYQKGQLLVELSSALYEHFSSQAAYELYGDVRPFLQRMHEIRARLETERSDPDEVLLIGVITNSDPRVRQVLESMGLRVGVSKPPDPRSRPDRWQQAKEIASDPDGLPISTPYGNLWSSHGHDFDFMATGYEAGEEKPCRAVFNRAAHLARLNLISRLEQRRRTEGDRDHPFREAFDFVRQTLAHRRDIETMSWIHVGDDYVKDYRGARESGIDAFHLVRSVDDSDNDSGGAEGGDKQAKANDEKSEKSSTKSAPRSHTLSNLIELVPIVNLMVEQNLFSRPR